MFNFFQLLHLPEQYTLDLAQLEAQYFAAQRQHHPDALVRANAAARATAIEQSQLINDAYDTLKDPLSRAEHLLQLKGYSINTEEAGAVASPLLMEMMELRERIHDNAGDGHALLHTVDDVKATARMCARAIEHAFRDEDYARAVNETTRLAYLHKALEEAYAMLYRYKAQARK